MTVSKQAKQKKTKPTPATSTPPVPRKALPKFPKLTDFTSTWRARREQAKLPRSQVAAEIGVNVQTVYRWEQAVLEPKADHLLKVERLLAEYGFPHPVFA